MPLSALAAAALLSGLSMQDAPIATARAGAESAEALRAREAIAYATPLPRGAPDQDYPLVAWCAALVEGHVALGRTLPADPLDAEIVRLGALEATDFRDALRIAGPRQTPAVRAAADRAEAAATARWAALADQDAAMRSQTFGLFFGLPGRCEHAARRIRAGVSAPPATLAQAGLDENGVPIPR